MTKKKSSKVAKTEVSNEVEIKTPETNSNVELFKDQLNKLKTLYTDYFDKYYKEFEKTKFEFGNVDECMLSLNFLNYVANWQYSDLVFLNECINELKQEIDTQKDEKIISVKNRVVDTVNRFLQKTNGFGFETEIGNDKNKMQSSEILTVFLRTQDCLQKTNDFRTLFKTIADKENSIISSINQMLNSLEHQVDNFVIKDWIIYHIENNYKENDKNNELSDFAISNKKELLNILHSVVDK